MNDIARVVLLVALGCNTGVSAATEPQLAGTSGAPTLPRIDAAVTPANSVLFDFGYGEVVRVPKILISPSSIPKDPKEPIRAKAISMTFWYPDMTLTGWVSLMDIIFEKKRGVYVSQKDRFRVNIVYLFYSPGDLRNLPPGQGELMEPGPEQIDRNLANGHKDLESRRFPSGLAGIDATVSERWAKAHPNLPKHDPTKGGDYVAKRGSPYELWMDCDGEAGVECVAHVYSKKYRFQYRMIFAPEAVQHTDELIRAIDKMIGRWPVETERQH